MIIYFLVVYGLTNIITQAAITEFIRDFFEDRNQFFHLLFSCPMCMGFWVGIFLKLSGYYSFFENMIFLDYLVEGAMASACAWILHNLIMLVGNLKDYLVSLEIMNDYDDIKRELLED